MTAERWARMKEIFGATLEIPEAQRGDYLESACGGDAVLRDEVQRLLAAERNADFGSPVSGMLRQPPALSKGQMLGRYRIVEKLGEGGMGVVYRAYDEQLRREVAIKMLSPDLASDPERRRRLLVEARAASALSHPHICTLHDIGEHDEQAFLVMEHLEGETLAQRLKQGPIALGQALSIGAQLADALDAAHKLGIVHRDLKPGNVMLTKSGAKLMDFGLAKLTRHREALESDPPTQEGVILGTLHYMAPEQLEGRPADPRTDLWALGVIIYEMLTRRRAFEGTSQAGLIAAILERDPAPLVTPDGAFPPAVDRTVRHCLEKNPEERFQSAGDLAFHLKSLLAGETVPGAGRPGSNGTRRLWLACCVAAAATVALATIAFLHFREIPPASTAPLRFQIPAPENAGNSLTLSPDGRKLAFIAGDRLAVHFLETGELRDLAAAELGVPFWSPDSRFIGYLSQKKLRKIEAAGGPPQTVADFAGRWGGGAWNRDDVIVFCDRPVGLFRVPASGGAPVRITALDPARHEHSHFCPSFLPDARHFVYIRASTEEGRSAIYLGSVDANPEQQSSSPLVASNSQPVYAPSANPRAGYLLFVREGTLMAQPFDNRRLEIKGHAAVVAQQVSDLSDRPLFVAFSASANDVLALPPSVQSNRRLTWFDREGKVTGTAGEPGAYENLALSPDGTRLAVMKLRGGDLSNIWLLDFSRGGASTRLTFGAAVDTNPVWSPDGSRVIFTSNRDGPYNLYQKPANGAQEEELLLKSSQDKLATSLSHDGRFLLYETVAQKTKSDIWVLPLGGDRKPFPFLISEFNERQARFSPDGHWAAYTSDESGQDEVYVQSFATNFAGTAVEAGSKWPISNGFGNDPQWRGDGRLAASTASR